MNGRRHREANQIMQVLRRERILALYHWTSIENLKSIRDMNALCSKQTLEKEGRWPPPDPGGNQLSHALDRCNNNWDKLSFSFTPYTPMAYNKKREKHLCFFVINPEVAALDGVVFTDTNAATISRPQRRGEGLSGLSVVNFQAVHSFPRPGDKEGWVHPVQAEVLVPDRLDLCWVTEIAFLSDASLQEAKRIWGNHPGPSFVPKPLLFSDSPASLSLSFPYLAKVVMTDDVDKKSTLDGSHIDKRRFRRRNADRITLVASVHALAGTNATVTWRPVEVVQTTEFEKSTDYRHWASIPMCDLPDGQCSVEYRLDQVRWATLEFKVVP